MRPSPGHYAALEASAIAAQRRADLTPEADPFAFEVEPGPHSRLVSVFAWHPLLRRDLGLPPIGLLLLAWISAAWLHVWARVPQPWGDEAFTWELAQGSWAHLLDRVVHDLHPPLYFALAHLLYGLGLHEFAQLRIAIYLPVALLLGLAPLAIQAWPLLWRRFAAMGALVLVLFPFDLYLVQLRYYGLLALFLVTAILALGNWLEGGPRATRWLLLSRVAFVLATWTNYQSWLVWIVADALALRLSRDRKTLLMSDIAPVLIALLGSWLVFHFAQLSPWTIMQEATASPFTTGFAHQAAEVVARLGVIGLVTVATEFVPLWWLPIVGCIALIWWLRSPHPQQSSLSLTATLCLQTATIVGIVMCLLTVSIIPVGVEFLPARLAYLLPLFWIGVAEWIMRRTYTLRGILAMLVVHGLVLGWGYQRCIEALVSPSPAPSAPFLHATYLTPTPGMRAIIFETVFGESASTAAPQVLCVTPGLELALGRSMPVHDWRQSPATAETIFIASSTRPEMMPAEVTAMLRAYQIDEEWFFVHEDPLWFRLKALFLDRDIAPYKYRLAKYRRPTFPAHLDPD